MDHQDKDKPDPETFCPRCGTLGDQMHCKIICPKCKIIILSCSDSYSWAEQKTKEANLTN